VHKESGKKRIFDENGVKSRLIPPLEPVRSTELDRIEELDG
jgi:hypothetical protein